MENTSLKKLVVHVEVVLNSDGPVDDDGVARHPVPERDSVVNAKSQVVLHPPRQLRDALVIALVDPVHYVHAQLVVHPAVSLWFRLRGAHCVVQVTAVLHREQVARRSPVHVLHPLDHVILVLQLLLGPLEEVSTPAQVRYH